VVQSVTSGVLDDADSSRYVWRLSGLRILLVVYRQRRTVDGESSASPPQRTHAS